MEIVVALVFVAVALGVVFVRLSNARRDAMRFSPATATDREDARPVEPTEPPVRREGLDAKVRSLFGAEAGADVWTELRETLLKADVGPSAADALVARVRGRWKPGADAAAILHEEIVTLLGPDRPLELPSEGLGVVLVVGVNGTGKTTTIGKLARRLSGEGRSVSLAGADTFRAAAGEQLEVWAVRAGAHLVQQERGGDPGAVVYDAVTSAKARGSDVLIVDTAGRLHTKTPLMDELRKLLRVVDKAGANVAETLLVLDATTGLNGIAQAKAFTEAVDVSGVVLTKVDGSAKGGVVLAVRQELGVPVRLIGTGEGLDDLQPFRSEAFAERILS